MCVYIPQVVVDKQGAEQSLNALSIHIHHQTLMDTGINALCTALDGRDGEWLNYCRTKPGECHVWILHLQTVWLPAMEETLTSEQKPKRR